MSRTLAILLTLLIIGLTSLALSQDETEAVLLRYRLEPGDVQVYEMTAKLSLTALGAQNGQKQNVSTVIWMRLPFSIRCTELADDGTMVAEIRFHGLSIDTSMRQNGQTVQMTADELGIKVTQNGAVVMQGAWGSPELSQFPDMRKLLEVALSARLTDRGEMVEITNLEELPQEFQGFDLTQALDNQVVYPEHPVAPGDSWEHDLAANMLTATLPSGPVDLVGTAKYTVLERTTHRNRECLRLVIEADLDTPDPGGAMNLDQTFEGTVYVDVATGVPLDSHLDLVQDLTGSMQGADFSLKGTGTITLGYIGGKNKYTELVGSVSAQAVSALSQLCVPMVTENRIKIDGKIYAKGDTVVIGGEPHTIVAYKPSALKLHRQSDSAVYQLGLGSGGRVTYVKLLGYAN